MAQQCRLISSSLVSQPKEGHQGSTEHENNPVLPVLTTPNCLTYSRHSNTHYEVCPCSAALTLEGCLNCVLGYGYLETVWSFQPLLLGWTRAEFESNLAPLLQQNHSETLPNATWTSTWWEQKLFPTTCEGWGSPFSTFRGILTLALSSFLKSSHFSILGSVNPELASLASHLRPISGRPPGLQLGSTPPLLPASAAAWTLPSGWHKLRVCFLFSPLPEITALHCLMHSAIKTTLSLFCLVFQLFQMGA